MELNSIPLSGLLSLFSLIQCPFRVKVALSTEAHTLMLASPSSCEIKPFTTNCIFHLKSSEQTRMLQFPQISLLHRKTLTLLYILEFSNIADCSEIYKLVPMMEFF